MIDFPGSLRRLSVAALLVATIVFTGSRAAQAYPQWQFSSGDARCNQCHFAPAGGGLINGYGRDAAGDDLSTWQGNGGFLHGAVDLPKWLALGADLRGAVVSQYVGSPGGAKTTFFPMQADVYGRVSAFDAWSLAVTGGVRGQVRKPGEEIDAGNAQPASLSRFISREHYLMWRPAALGVYVRAGRFFAPYGLRLSEHTSYIERDLGFNLLEESYNVSAGIVQNDWEAHFTAFVPDFIRRIGAPDKGFAVMFERRFADMAALGVQTRLGFGDDTNRYAGGLFGKIYLEKVKTLLMAEGDGVYNTFKGVSSGGGAYSFVGYVGATVFPVRGLWGSVYAERRQTALTVSTTATNAYAAQVNWFPYPHFELFVLGRLQDPAGSEALAKTLLFFIHYYL